MLHFIAADVQVAASPYYPLFVLAVGIAVVIGGIMALRVNAFIALLTAAIVVSLMAPGDIADKISRVANAFGSTMAAIGIVIALAAIIGKAMMESGAADRIVRAFLGLLGEKRGGVALTASGFTLGVPVFFDTVFYLLVPLARSMYRRTGHSYVKYLMAIAAGGAVTHTLVPPTPGPLYAANAFGVDLGTMILMAALIGLPTAAAGLLFAGWVDKRMPIAMRPMAGGHTEPEPLPDTQLPPLLLALLPILLPVILIAGKTIADTMVGAARNADNLDSPWFAIADWMNLIGNPNLALLLSAAVAVATLWWMRRPTREQMSASVEEALMSAGIIILITAAGGAFGKMLQEAGIARSIEFFVGDSVLGGLGLLTLAFVITGVIRFAQGSSTAAIIAGSAMIVAMIVPRDQAGLVGNELADFIGQKVGYHPVYLAVAIGAGSLVLSWMNDSGFWIFSKMGGLTEAETLKSWSPLLTILGCTAFVVACILAMILPLV